MQSKTQQSKAQRKKDRMMMDSYAVSVLPLIDPKVNQAYFDIEGHFLLASNWCDMLYWKKKTTEEAARIIERAMMLYVIWPYQSDIDTLLFQLEGSKHDLFTCIADTTGCSVLESEMEDIIRSAEKVIEIRKQLNKLTP